jgi:hypothetical protein
MANVFLSYKQGEDRQLAQTMEAALIRAGLSVWWDDHAGPQERWHEILERELEAAKHVLVLWTEHSRASDFVRDEATRAKDAKPSKLIQVRFDDLKPPIGFGSWPCLDLDRDNPESHTNWPKLLGWLGAAGKVEVAGPKSIDPAEVEISPASSGKAPKQAPATRALAAIHRRLHKVLGDMTGTFYLILAVVFLIAVNVLIGALPPRPLSKNVGNSSEAVSAVPRTSTGHPSASSLVTLVAMQEVWVQITEAESGAPLFGGRLRPTEMYVVPVSAQRPILRTGRPQLLRVSVGDRDLGPLETGERTFIDFSLRPADLIRRADRIDACEQRRPHEFCPCIVDRTADASVSEAIAERQCMQARARSPS